MKKSTALPIAILVFILISACCLVTGILALGGYMLFKDPQVTQFLQELNAMPTSSPNLPRTGTSLDPGELNDSAYVTLDVLQQSVVPENDPIDLAARLQGIKDVPRTLPAPLSPRKIGDNQAFWITNDDTLESSQVRAVLRYRTKDIYFWIQDGVSYNPTDVEKLVHDIDDKIIPTDRKFFGEEWIPGVDNDPHIYILYTRGLGGVVLGYFSAPDEYPPAVTEYANGHEMFVLSADYMVLGDEEIRSTIAHEFQHMIHWYRDRNEESWINEGFSQLAELLNGYTPQRHDYTFAAMPDTQLNDWSSDNEVNSAHYGAALLFMSYFLDRFGEDVSKALVYEQENGVSSVDKVLHDLDVRDPGSGKPIGVDDVFADWAAAWYLNDPSVMDGRYAFSFFKDPAVPTRSDTIDTCPTQETSTDVRQYGIDYILITCNGEHTIEFQGVRNVSLMPEKAYSGDFSFWSNQGDLSNPTLTRKFDLTDTRGNVMLSYKTWYSIEKDWDYVYVEASTNGTDWTILDTPSCTNYDPTGNSYGCGYTGDTNGWIEESVDLSSYAGQKVFVRFDYVTDTAVNMQGFLLDDVRVDAIGYFDDFEKAGNDWVANGFVRVENQLPQTYRVMLITLGDQTTVIPVVLDDRMRATIPISIGSGVDQVVLIVSGTARFTREPAPYSYSVR